MAVHSGDACCPSCCSKCWELVLSILLHGTLDCCVCRASQRPLVEELPVESAPVPSATAATSASPSAPQPQQQQRSGLKGGFFNSRAKPKRGILKRSGPPAQPREAALQREEASVRSQASWSVSPALVRKTEPSEEERTAFSGTVRERLGSSAATTVRRLSMLA